MPATSSCRGVGNSPLDDTAARWSVRNPLQARSVADGRDERQLERPCRSGALSWGPLPVGTAHRPARPSGPRPRARGTAGAATTGLPLRGVRRRPRPAEQCQPPRRGALSHTCSESAGAAPAVPRVRNTASRCPPEGRRRYCRACAHRCAPGVPLATADSGLPAARRTARRPVNAVIAASPRTTSNPWKVNSAGH